MDRLLLAVESSQPGLVEAAHGLAALLRDRATVFVPLPAVAPEARSAPRTPEVVVLGVDDTGAGADIGVWVGRFVESYPRAVVVCTARGRSVRVHAMSRTSAREEVAALLSS